MRASRLQLVLVVAVGLSSSRAAGQSTPPPDLPGAAAPSGDASGGGGDDASGVPEPPVVSGRRLLFYRDLDAGSESLFNPATVVISVGLGWYGLLGQDPLVQDIGSGGAVSRLWAAYAHPLASIQARGGWGSFAETEILFPLLIPIHPNMYFHMLGEGMLSRKLDEYFLAHGLSRGWSTTLALGTMFVSQQLNELIEQQSMARIQLPDGASRRYIDGADSLADGALWNNLGMVAFQFDAVAGLFNNRFLSMAFWPGQAAVDVRSGRLFNQAEMYRTAIKLPATERLKLTWIGGSPIFALGISARVYRDHTIGAAFGAFFAQTNAVELARVRRADGTLWVSDVLRASESVMLHWERDGSLMASLALQQHGVRLNLYPATIPLGSLRLGLYVDAHAGDPGAVGLSLAYLPVVPGVQW